MSLGLGLGLRLYPSNAASEPPITPPTLWTPANIGSDLAFWIDGADSASMTLNGSTVQQVNDKSGNNRHAVQLTGTRQPAYTSAGLNGLNVLTFDGIDDLFLDNAFSMLRNCGYGGVWSVVSINNTTSNKTLFFYPTTGGATTSLFSAFISSASTTIGGRRLFTDGFAQISGSNVTANNPFIYGGEIEWSNATAYLSVNGNTPNSGAFQTAGNTQNTATTFQPAVGSNSGTANYLAGFIAEQVLLVSTARPTSDTITRIEGYLAHKWGLTANLPLAHPYKTNAPTV